jgi:hypothetical protein
MLFENELTSSIENGFPILTSIHIRINYFSTGEIEKNPCLFEHSYHVPCREGEKSLPLIMLNQHVFGVKTVNFKLEHNTLQTYRV